MDFSKLILAPHRIEIVTCSGGFFGAGDMAQTTANIGQWPVSSFLVDDDDT